MATPYVQVGRHSQSSRSLPVVSKFLESVEIEHNAAQVHWKTTWEKQLNHRHFNYSVVRNKRSQNEENKQEEIKSESFQVLGILGPLNRVG